MFPNELRGKPGHVEEAADCSCPLALITHCFIPGAFTALALKQLTPGAPDEAAKALQDRLQTTETGCKCS